MPVDISDHLQDEFRTLESQARVRVCPVVSGQSRTSPTVDGQKLISFSSNDYLGLSGHPDLANAAIASIRHSGFGASGSRLVSGNFPEHRALEDALSLFLQVEGAVLFPTGYHANLGVLTSITGPGDLILCDHFNHASIIDACRLSRSRPAFYRHLDLSHLEKKLKALSPNANRKYIVTESLFGMDGHIAPLVELSFLATKYNAALIIDEAHALGVVGPSGKGVCHQAGVKPFALIGTLGKAFGSSGGFVAGSLDLCRHLVNKSRPFIFTTASPPSTSAAALAALKIIDSAEGSRLRRDLTSLATVLSASYPLRHMASRLAPIFPLIVGHDHEALRASHALRKLGIFVQPIRPPTVPEGTARLRITLSATHSPKEVLYLATSLDSILHR